MKRLVGTLLGLALFFGCSSDRSVPSQGGGKGEGTDELMAAVRQADFPPSTVQARLCGSEKRKQLMAKLSLPHTSADGRSPGQLEKEFEVRLTSGDKVGAAKLLALVASIVKTEGGLFDPTLAKLAEKALHVNEDREFVSLLIGVLPGECVVVIGPEGGDEAGCVGMTECIGFSFSVLHNNKQMTYEVLKRRFDEGLEQDVTPEVLELYNDLGYSRPGVVDREK